MATFCAPSDVEKVDDYLQNEMTVHKTRSKSTSDVSFLRCDIQQYVWSTRTLDCHLRHFQIFYTDTSVSVDHIRTALCKELEGPGILLGYRTKQTRPSSGLLVPRDLVHTVIFDMDPEGLQAHASGRKERRPKGHFTSNGPTFVHSFDSHDKVMRYQHSAWQCMAAEALPVIRCYGFVYIPVSLILNVCQHATAISVPPHGFCCSVGNMLTT